MDNDPKTGVVYLGNLQAAMGGTAVSTGPIADLDDAVPADLRRKGRSLNLSHEAWPSADNKTLYVGGSTAEFETVSILDISKWLKRDTAGKPLGPLVVVSQKSGRGHSVRTATIHGVPYLLHSEESVFGKAYGRLPQEGAPFVGPAQPWLTDIEQPQGAEARLAVRT